MGKKTQILFSLLTSIQTIYITGKKNLTPLCCFSIPFSRAVTVKWQERSVALHTMLGKCSGMTEEKVSGFSARPRTEKGWSLLLCWVHFFIFLPSTGRLQEGTSRLRRAAGPVAERAGAPHRAHPGPLSWTPKLPHGIRFSAEQGAGGAFWPSSLPWQPSSFCTAVTTPRAPFWDHYPPLPSCSSLATASFPTQITS